MAAKRELETTANQWWRQRDELEPPVGVPCVAQKSPAPDETEELDADYADCDRGFDGAATAAPLLVAERP